MWHKAVSLTLLTLTLSTTAIPLPSLKHAKETSLTEAQILQIAPTSNTCENPPAEGECATASQAAKFISQSFNTYEVSSKAEQAAVIGLMAFESEDFKYNKNHFPGTPGQGITARNMQSPTFNKKYASSISALKDKLAAVENSPADLLDLLRDNETYDFGSGAWFLTTQCSADIRTALKAGTESGWQRFISECVGTEASSDRKAYWQKAVKALA
ncbi:uncharacterized protein N7483_012290 [Penicillium malachiteum]|uniref:uncharacterized protein n=1 Tax=Penicillium malachiteum TaxID=1324776 RepID=UPI0025486855|nr:uncharacterized protein N7483_012290 [Penicillium malachiteum]KAJ5715109.1 hypothetical protein N7483_012290 [Penicillium malachiteum]